MKNKLILFSFLLVSFVSNSSAKEILKSRFNKDILVDGLTTDWKDQTMYANSDLKLMFSISNDNENIYLMIKSNDRATQQKIRKNGISCWISTKGKKKDDVGFVFPYMDKNQVIPSQMMPDAPTDLKREGASLLGYEKQDKQIKLNKISVKGFKGLKDSVFELENAEIQAIIKREKDALVLEFKIPLKNLNPITDKTVLAIGIGIMEDVNAPSSFHGRPDFDSENQAGGRGFGNMPPPQSGSLNDDTLMPTDQRMNNDMPHQDKEKLKMRKFWFYATLSNLLSINN